MPRVTQLALEHDAVVVVAIEDGHLAQGNVLVARLEDLLADQVGLFVDIGRGGDHGLQALRPGPRPAPWESPIGCAGSTRP